MLLINEVAKIRPKVLKNIDKTFKLIKHLYLTEIKDPNKPKVAELKKINRLASEYLSSILDVKVEFRIDPKLGFNAYVVLTGPVDIYDGKTGDRISSEDELKKSITNIQFDFSKVKKVYIIYGHIMLCKLTPRECTAVLLHELGHLYHFNKSMLSSIASAIKSFLMIRKIYFVPIGLLFILFVHLPFLPIYLLTLRTLTFAEHMAEYDADKFATQLGYGDELASVFHKMQGKKKSFKMTEKTNFFKKIFLKIKFLFQKLINIKSHPKSRDRVCSIIMQMKNQYVNLYKNKSNYIEQIANEYTC